MTSTDIVTAIIVKKKGSLRVSRNRLKIKLGLDNAKSLYDFERSFKAVAR